MRTHERIATEHAGHEIGRSNDHDRTACITCDVWVEPQPPAQLEQSIARLGSRDGPDHVRLLPSVLRFLSGFVENACDIPVVVDRFGADMQVSLVNDGPVTIPMTVR